MSITCHATNRAYERLGFHLTKREAKAALAAPNALLAAEFPNEKHWIVEIRGKAVGLIVAGHHVVTVLSAAMMVSKKSRRGWHWAEAYRRFRHAPLIRSQQVKRYEQD